jgi:hypothetical protein
VNLLIREAEIQRKKYGPSNNGRDGSHEQESTHQHLRRHFSRRHGALYCVRLDGIGTDHGQGDGGTATRRCSVGCRGQGDAHYAAEVWAPVEAALHDMAQWQAKGSPELKSSDRAGSAVAHRLRRIAAMAVPLIKALDENQRRSMMMLARSAGLEQLLASK